MWWLNPYRPRFGVDWPCNAIRSDQAGELDWRVRLAVLGSGLAVTALVVGLALLVGGR